MTLLYHAGTDIPYLTADNKLGVVAAIGSAPAVDIAQLDGIEDQAYTIGKVLFFFTDLDEEAWTGTLNFWSRAGGTKLNVASNAAWQFQWVSPDADRTAFLFDYDDPSGSVKLAVTSVANPSTQPDATTKVLADVDWSKPECFYRGDFNGVGDLLLGVCHPATDNALRLLVFPKTGDIRRVDAGEGDPARLISGVVEDDLEGGTFIAELSDEGARIIDPALAPAAGGFTTLPTHAPKKLGRFTSDHAYLFPTAGGGLDRVEFPTGGSPTTKNLFPDGYRFTLGLARDGSRIAFSASSTTETPVPGAELYDLKIADAKNTGMVTTLANPGIEGGFTHDSQFYVYVSDVVSAENPFGKVTAHKTADGTNIVLAENGTLPRALSDSKVVFASNLNLNELTGDLQLVDIKDPELKVTTFATGAKLPFDVVRDDNGAAAVVYQTATGLYAFP